MVPENNMVTVDLTACTVTAPDQTINSFEIAPADREMLLEGLDAIAVTMRRDGDILAFQEQDKSNRPWIYI